MSSVSEQKRPNDSKRLKREREILECVRAILADKGYSNFSMRSVAAAAGLHLKTVQYYLPTKRQRLTAALSPEGTPVPAGFVLDDLIEKIHQGPAPRQIAGTDISLLLDLRLHEVEPGVDILWGTDDLLLPLAYGQRLHAGLSRSRFHELPNCGHMPHQQCPGPFVETLFAALAEEPPAASSDSESPDSESPDPESPDPESPE